MSQNHGTRQNVEWAEAIIKWTRYDYVAMYDYPTLKNSEQVMQIYTGDAVEISKRYRREDWCLVQVGHTLGWVFLQDVRFITRGMKPPRPKTRPPQPRVPSRIEPDYSEVETAPASDFSEFTEDTRPAQREPIIKPGTGELSEEKDNSKVSMVKKLIGFFRK